MSGEEEPLVTKRSIPMRCRLLGALLPVLLASCPSLSEAVRVQALVGAPGDPSGFIRATTDEALVGGKAAASAQLVVVAAGNTGTTIPVWAYAVEGGRVRYVDRSEDIDETTDWGDPIHPGAARLFEPGEAEALGITFRETAPE